MPTTDYNTDAIIEIRTKFEDDTGAGILDADGKVYISRFSDNMFWDGDNITPQWVVGRIFTSMTEIDETNKPGEWGLDFDSSVGDDLETYQIEPVDDAGNAINKVEIGTARVGFLLAETLGLLGQNFVLEPLTFDTTNNVMTTGEIRIYDSPANATTDDGATGLLNKQTITAPRSVGVNRLLKYTSVLA